MSHVAFRRQQKGFTVIELLIATAIFSLVLLMVTFGIIQITRVYYKGVTETNTQSAARSIVDTISQSIQFGGTGNIQATSGSTPGTSYGFCIGNQLLSYVLGYQVVDSPNSSLKQSYHGLVVSSAASCGGPVGPVANLRTTANIPNSRELIGKNMRLSKLSVQPVAGTSNLWNITVKVMYGDDDVFTTAADNPNAACKNIVQGTQFCAVSELNTIVEKRVQ